MDEIPDAANDSISTDNKVVRLVPKPLKPKEVMPVEIDDPNQMNLLGQLPAISTTPRWVVAIQNVPPTSGAFWFDYGKRYNENIVIELQLGKKPRACNVKVYSTRSVGDVVLSAWNEYNQRHSSK